MNMIDPLDKEINVDEIMEKIREELRRRGKLPIQEVSFSQETLPPIEPPLSQALSMINGVPKKTSDGKKLIDRFLWKYGRKYKKIIKGTPFLKKIAQKEHQRLAQKVIYSPLTAQSIYSSPVNYDNLPYYINYHGFLEQAKEKEGIKGIAKYHLFKLIRYFAWWQEQINRALYQELIAHKARMDEKEKWIQELYHQQFNRLTDELMKRDQIIEDIHRKLLLFDQAKEELSRGLVEQRAKLDEKERLLVSLLNQQIAKLGEGLDERDKVIEDLCSKLSLLGQAKDKLSQALDIQKNKIDEMHEGIESLFHRLMEDVKKESNERSRWVERIDKQLVQLDRVQEEINQKLTFQKMKLDEVMRETKNILNQELSHLKIDFEDVHKKLNDKIESTQKKLSMLAVIQVAITQIKEEVEKHKHEILDQQRKLSISLEENRLPDELYVAFENQFRGSREELKERFRAYLPYVRETLIGETNLPVLDLGCGRGEWLELLKESGYIGKGVDINGVMVKQCQELGLDVTQLEILDYLKNQESNSFSIITGFHLLEHLPIKRILLLFDEVFRVLRRGGIAIFETPNPENLLVATSNFYLDPTHLHPLPSGLLSFLMESRGFKIMKIERRNPDSFAQEVQKTSISVESIMSLFNQGRDYSIIAKKE